MAYLPLILKITLCMSVFVSAFLSVFRKTIDDNKRLTRHGYISIVCVCVTFCMGTCNELLAVRKEARSQADKKAADAAALVVQVKLDQALDEGRKRGDEAKAYMLEAASAKSRLEAVQEKLDDIEKRVSDPTVQKMLSEVKRMTGSDITVTSERLSTLSKLLSDVHDDLGEVRGAAADGRDAARSARTDIASLKSELDMARQEIDSLRRLVAPPKPDAGLPDVQPEQDVQPDVQPEQDAD